MYYLFLIVFAALTPKDAPTILAHRR